MFCEKCGMQNEDGAQFCQGCGEVLTNGAAPAPESAPKFDFNKLPIVPIVGAVAVVIILILIFGGNGPKKAVKSYVNALKKQKVEKLINYTLPKDIQEEYFENMEELMDMDREELVEKMEEELDDSMDDIKNIKYEIKDIEKLNKLDKLEDEMEERDVEDLDDFIEKMDDRYEDYDFDADKIKQAYAVEYKLKWKEDGKSKNDKIIDIVYKYKGKWYFLNGAGF